MADKGAKIIIVTKKAKGHAAHHGGAWKVAYADFVTAMMALFMVLWLVSQTDQKTRQKLSEYFRTGLFSGAQSLVMGGTGVSEMGYLDAKGGPLQLEQKALGDSAAAVRAALKKAQKADPELAKIIARVDVRVTDNGLLIQILDGGDDLIFELSSAELKPKLKELLATMAPVLGRLPNHIQIHGHTDARPFPVSSGRSNWDLSFMRADTARKALEEHGMNPAQVAGVFAHGASSPYVPEDPLDPRNRRLTILAVAQGAEELVGRGIVPKRPLVPIQKTGMEKAAGPRQPSPI